MPVLRRKKLKYRNTLFVPKYLGAYCDDCAIYLKYKTCLFKEKKIDCQHTYKVYPIKDVLEKL